MERRPPYGVYLPGALAVAVGGILIPWIAKAYAAAQGSDVPSFFPWWTQALVLVGFLLAWWRLRLRRTEGQRVFSLGALTLIALHLIGLGAVALRHAGPYCRVQGCGSEQVLVLAGALVALSGVLSLALCLGETAWSRSRGTHGRSSRVRTVLVLAAVITGASTPVLAARLSDGWFVTALGSALLAFAGPWAAGLGLAAWMNRASYTRGVLLAQALVAAAAMVGPRFALYPNENGPTLAWVFLPALVVALTLLIGVRRPRELRR